MTLDLTKATGFALAKVGFGVLALAGGWLIVTEATRSHDLGRSGTPWISTAIAGVRGDLWRERLQAAEAGLQPPASARRFAARAVEHAPVAPEAWLVLAETAGPVGQQQAALAMACATGPASVALMIRRIAVAVAGSAITDALVEGCVRADVRHILLRDNRLLRDLIAIDRAAPRAGRNRLRAIIRDIDPKLAASLPAL